MSETAFRQLRLPRFLQVRAYSGVFWERYTELNDFERIIKNIERGEQRIQRQADIMAAIAAKLDRYRNPWQARATAGPTPSLLLRQGPGCCPQHAVGAASGDTSARLDVVMYLSPA